MCPGINRSPAKIVRYAFSFGSRSALLFAIVIIAGCGSGRSLTPPARYVYPDTLAITQPDERTTSLIKEAFNKSFDYQVKQILDFPRGVRKVTDNAYEALNVDNFDEVPNSSWFTNRNGVSPMTLDAIRRGPNRHAGPDTSGAWTIEAGKSAGTTPGFTILDARGDRYFIKFDPPNYPELPSGAEAVSARLFYAAGYNVPENTVAYMHPDKLVIHPDAKISLETNDKRPAVRKHKMTQENLNAVLNLANPSGKPQIRVLASRALDGVIIGPWPYGVRKDDPNDIYSHEHRRELRGLHVIAAWLNHADMKEENTLDAYDPESGYVRHYLFDFGASLGSNSKQASNPRRGQANGFDMKHALVHMLTLGLYVYDYERAPQTIRYPSVGYLENDLFNPKKWKPIYPAPSFENLTRRDAFWGTKIVTSFTDEQIEAAVSTGEYSDPGAAETLSAFIKERRDITGRYWFTRVNTLDRFEIRKATGLKFTDLAVARGYADAGKTRYQIEVLSPDGTTLHQQEQMETVVTPDPTWQAYAHIVVSLLPRRPDYQAKPVLVYLRYDDSRWEVIGLRRLD